MKFKLIPILVLFLLLIPFVANGAKYTHELENPLYFHDCETWNNNYILCDRPSYSEWEIMQQKLEETYPNHEFRKINTNDNTFITNITDLCSTQYVFSVTDLSVEVRANKTTEKIVLDLEIEDKSLNLYTTNLSHTIRTKDKDGNQINITQLYYNVIISNITFNVLSKKEKEITSQDDVYAFNITNNIKLVNLKGKDFTTLTNLYSETKFVCTDQDYEISINSNYNYITNNSPIYVNGEEVGNFSENKIKWKSGLLKKGEYIQIKEISFLPFSSVTNAWKKSEKGLVRQSISNFVANASNINSNFYNSVTNYFETNKATLLPKVSITNKCKQPVKVQIGDEVFDLNSSTTTNIVNQPLFVLFDNKPINYWVTNSCSKCPITTNVVDQTFNKYNRDDYVLTLENIPLQEDEGFSYVSISNIPKNATVEFNGKKLSPTDGIITISTNSHTTNTNGSFVITQPYYEQTNLIFTSGCINSTTNYACPKLTPLDWQRCSITNTSEYPCDIKISYSNIINDVAIAITNVTIDPNFKTDYELNSDSIDPIDVIFSWNTNTITNTFTRGEKDPINIEVQGMDPVSAFVDNLDKKTKTAINKFCDNVKQVKDNKYNVGNSENLIYAFNQGIFKEYDRFEVVTNIITKAIKEDNKSPSKDFLVEDQSQIRPEFLGVISNAFYKVHQNKKENKNEK